VKAIRARGDLVDLKIRTFALRKPAAPIDDFWSTLSCSNEPVLATTPKEQEVIHETPVDKVAEVLTNGDIEMHIDEAS
jgi:hypothetical protein